MKQTRFDISPTLFSGLFFLLMCLVGSAGALENAGGLSPQETVTAPAPTSKETGKEAEKLPEDKKIPAMTAEPPGGKPAAKEVMEKLPDAELPENKKIPAMTAEPPGGKPDAKEVMEKLPDTELPENKKIPAMTAEPPGDIPAAEKEGGLLRELTDNALYSVKTWGAVFDVPFPKTGIADDDDLKFMTRLTAKSKATISDRLFFEMELFGTYSTGADELRGVFGDLDAAERKGRILEARRALLLAERDDYDVAIGKALVPVGLSNIFVPSNRYELLDAADPTRFETMGVWQINVNYYIEDDKLSYTFMPYHERSSSPDGRSRWLGSSGDPSFYSLPASVTGTPTGTTPTVGSATGTAPSLEERFWSIGDVKSWGHLVNYKGVRSGYDFFALAHFGPSAYPVIKQEASKFFKVNPLALTVAGGVSSTIKAWNLYSEGSYQLTNNDEDQDFLKYVLGVSYRETDFAAKLGLEEIFPVLEYAGELLTDIQSKDGYIVDSDKSRPGRNTLLFKIDFRQDDKFTYQFFWTRNLMTIDETRGGIIEYRYDDSLSFQLIRAEFLGRDDTQFGRWNTNDYVTLYAHYKF